jgi:putative transposase
MQKFRLPTSEGGACNIRTPSTSSSTRPLIARLKLCNIVDEHTRVALAMDVGRHCTADDIVAIIEQLVATRGAPEHQRMDNEPELIAWALRDRCRMHSTTT